MTATATLALGAMCVFPAEAEALTCTSVSTSQVLVIDATADESLYSRQNDKWLIATWYLTTSGTIDVELRFWADGEVTINGSSYPVYDGDNMIVEMDVDEVYGISWNSYEYPATPTTTTTSTSSVPFLAYDPDFDPDDPWQAPPDSPFGWNSKLGRNSVSIRPKTTCPAASESLLSRWP